MGALYFYVSKSSNKINDSGQIVEDASTLEKVVITYQLPFFISL